MGPELETVVGGDGKNVVPDGSEQHRHRVGEGLGRAVVRFFEQQKARTSLDNGEDRPFLSAADDGICFPVAQAGPLVDHRRPFRDRPPGVPTLAVVIFTVAFPVHVLPP